jgi:hypothetical protein
MVISVFSLLKGYAQHAPIAPAVQAASYATAQGFRESRVYREVVHAAES